MHHVLINFISVESFCYYSLMRWIVKESIKPLYCIQSRTNEWRDVGTAGPMVSPTTVP
jgi:hypothetical protein